MGEAVFEVVGEWARFQLIGKFDLEDGVREVTNAIAHAKASAIDKLLVDILAAEIRVPSVMERYSLMVEWAQMGRGAVRVAVLVHPEMLDPERFGTSVALNHGLILKGFTSEQPAMDWLLGRLGGSAAPTASST